MKALTKMSVKSDHHTHTHTFTSDGANLTPEDLVRVARSEMGEDGSAKERVALSPHALQAVMSSHLIVHDIVERGEVVYGITTGFGAFKDHLISRDDLEQLQVNLILSHCTGVGDPLPTEAVRAMMLSRAHALSLGYSGIRPQTLRLLYEMLNAGITPIIPEQGSVGSSGDLAPLAHLALAMIGGGDVAWRGQTLPAREALDACGLEPAVLAPKEGLAITNGTNLMSGLLSLATVDAASLLATADVVAALTLEALQATPNAFDPRIHAARPHAGQVEVAANIRALTGGSELLYRAEGRGSRVESGDGKTTSHKVQDAYSLRCIPQVHGAARDTVAHVHRVLTTELNSANDNPLIFSDEGRGPRTEDENHSVLSGGNFHGAPLSVAADVLGIGVCQIGLISERRQARLLDPGANGGLLPPFLTRHGGLNSGFMMLQYTSAALASENKSLAHPASVDTIPTSNGWEDVNSMGPIAARQARAIVANTARILALEALCAAQAIDFRLQERSESQMGPGSRAAYELIRTRVPFIEHDEDVRPHIAAAEQLVLSGELARVLTSVR
jgi:histidine ammonia-lyase